MNFPVPCPEFCGKHSPPPNHGLNLIRMHPASLVAITRNTFFILALALVAPSCGSAEHVAPNSLNVEKEPSSPNNSLYRHHDIMLEMKKTTEVFGLVDSGPTYVQEFNASAQEPSKEATPVEAKLARAEAPVRPESASALAASKLSADQLWRVRVFEPQNVSKPIVFDHAGIAPKIGAARPAILADKPKPVLRSMHKPLRKRELTRLGADGQLIRTHKKPGSVI